MSDFKFMLAAKADEKLLRYPVLASVKIDGIRAAVINRVVVSRNMKPIRNEAIQRKFGRAEFEGLDGELVAGNPYGPDTYNRCQRTIMTRDAGADDVGFHVFDTFKLSRKTRYADRLYHLEHHFRKRTSAGVYVLQHMLLDNKIELQEYEEFALEEGYEGVMLRDPDGLYKFGRSTANEGGLLKLKRFDDSEAIVERVIPLVRNGSRDDKRVGSIVGYDPKRRWSVSVGSGFTDEDRVAIMRMWRLGQLDAGAKFRYRFFPTGTTDAPRFPTWGGWRDDN